VLFRTETGMTFRPLKRVWWTMDPGRPSAWRA